MTIRWQRSGAQDRHLGGGVLKIGVLNLFWFGLQQAHNSLGIGFLHDADDDVRVGGLIGSMGVDLVAFVEIVDIARLEAQLATLPGAWRVRDDDGAAVASFAEAAGGDGKQRVVFAWNDNVVELVRWGRPIAVEPGRPPVVARFKSRASEKEWTAVAVHPKSGALVGWRQLPVGHDDRKAGERRLALFEKVAAWATSPPPEYEGPTVILGDFNSVKGSPETAPLLALPGWAWPEPAFVPSTAERRTTKMDHAIIDHLLLSPHWTFGDHEALAFDVDPAYPNALDPQGLVWKRTTDHRPVRMRVTL